MTQSPDDDDLPEGETSEEAPKIPPIENKPAKKKGRKRLGPRWNPMNGVYWDSTASDFPKID